MEDELERITSKIMDEAKAKGDEIIGQGKRDAKSILDEAQVRSKAAQERILKEAERDAGQGRKRQVADATIKARKGKLGAREDIIDEAFRRSDKKLSEIANSSKYPAILENLVKEACIEIGDGEIEVIVRKEDAKIIEKRLSSLEKSLKSKDINAKLSLSKETINELGVITRSRDGMVGVSNTLGSRLERMRPALRLEVSKILFK